MARKEKVCKIIAEGTVIPAHPLALDECRRLDEAHQRLLTKYYLHAGAGGVAVGVHTTQFAIRNAKVGLYRPVLELAAEECRKYEKTSGRTVVKIAGVCGRTQQALSEASLAAELGYDCVLLSPGGLSDQSEAQLLQRAYEVAKVLPVFGFYLQPSVGGRVFTYEFWQRLCAIPGVIAIKAAPFNRYLSMDVARAAAFSERADEIALYTGNDDNIVIDLLTTYRFTEEGRTREIGFRGGLLGHWAVWTRGVTEMFKKIKTEREKPFVSAEMLTLAAEVTDCNSAFFDTANGFKGCIAGLHEVLVRQGLMKTIVCVDEHEGLSPGQKQEIDRVYRMYPHLCDDDYVREQILPLL